MVLVTNPMVVGVMKEAKRSVAKPLAFTRNKIVNFVCSRLCFLFHGSFCDEVVKVKQRSVS